MMIIKSARSTTSSLVIRLLALLYCLAAICLTSAFSGTRATPPPSYNNTGFDGDILRPMEHAIKKKRSSAGVLQATQEELHGELERVPSSSSSSLSSSYKPYRPVNNDDDINQDNYDQQDRVKDNNVVTLSSSNDIGAPTSASRWKRRKEIAMGLAVSIAITAGAAKVGWLGADYTNEMIARDATMTGLTSVLAVIMNRSITMGYEAGKYDSKTGRKLTHILSAPLFIGTWPFFSGASGARMFASLVTLTNGYRLYLAGTGDAAESSMVKTISRSGDKSEVLGGPFIYVCLFQLFIFAFWRNTFPGVVAMTTMAAGDGMADIVGRRYGKNGYKWPFSDGQKSLVGTVAFAVSAFALTLGMVSWLIATGALSSSLTFDIMLERILAISCICALVEVLPVGDDNYTVPGSAALLSALWLR